MNLGFNASVLNRSPCHGHDIWGNETAVISGASERGLVKTTGTIMIVR